MGHGKGSLEGMSTYVTVVGSDITFVWPTIFLLVSLERQNKEEMPSWRKVNIGFLLL